MTGRVLVSMAQKQCVEGGRTVLVGVDAARGTLAWEIDLGPESIVSCDTSGVTLYENLLYAATTTGGVVCANTAGEVLWHCELTGPYAPSTVWRSAPVVTRSALERDAARLLTTSLEGDIHCLDAAVGKEVWRVSADPAGIWGPVSVDITRSHFTVLAGVWLQDRDMRDGSVIWQLPSGFDAYTRPIFQGQDIVVCGGDPPDNGYLLRLDAESLSPVPLLDVKCRRGEQRDFLSVKCAWPGRTRVSFNLRHLGWSESEPARHECGYYSWQGEIDPAKRGAETVALAVGAGAGGTYYKTLPLDLGAGESPEHPSARVLEEHELPRPQPNARESGGRVIEAVARHAGKAVDAGDAEHAAVYMRQTGLHPHHVWRGGSVRMFMASTMPLVEEGRTEVSLAHPVEHLSRWRERAQEEPQDPVDPGCTAE